MCLSHVALHFVVHRRFQVRLGSENASRFDPLCWNHADKVSQGNTNGRQGRLEAFSNMPSVRAPEFLTL